MVFLWCLGGVFVRFCSVSVMSGGGLEWQSRLALLGNLGVSVVSLWCFGDVSVYSAVLVWWCLGGAFTVSRC